MKGFALIIVSFLVIAFGYAYAEEQIITVPGEGWKIRFDAPKLTPTAGDVPSIFFGKADRFQLSFFVEPPRCLGGDSDENIYACWAEKLQQNPYVDWDTERANKTSNGVQVMYMSTGRDAFNILFISRDTANGQTSTHPSSLVEPVERNRYCAA